MSIPLREQFATWLVQPDASLVVVRNANQNAAELVWQAVQIGYDRLAGELADGIDAWTAASQPTASTELLNPEQPADRRILDIRQLPEFAGGHLPGVRHIELGAVELAADTLPRTPTVVMCGHGERAVLVGGMLGHERTVLPLLAEREFGLTTYTSALTFIIAFGATKAVTNFFAGTLCDRHGRKPALVAGWLAALPVPLMLIWAPSWGWVIAANVLVGINQGLTWSTTVIMKIDLAGPERRGLAMGLNEAAGYLALSATALATGYLAARYGCGPSRSTSGSPTPPSVRTVRRRRRGDPGAHPPRSDHARPPLGRATRLPARGDVRSRGIHAHQFPGTCLVRRSTGRDGEQPQRRIGLGTVSGAICCWRPVDRADRRTRGALSRGMGPGPGDHRSALGPDRTQAPHHRR